MDTILTSPVLQWFADNHGWLQIIPLVCGITYMTLQIFQHKWMWYFSIVTSLAALTVAVTNLSDGEWAPLWAQVALNGYLIVIAIIGIIRWRKLDKESGGKIHVVHLNKQRLLMTFCTIAVLTPVLSFILSRTSDPMPVLDAASLVFSIVAAWLLSQSHAEQYFYWIIANTLIVSVYATQDKWLMAIMYSLYIVTCVIGFMNWKKNGVVVE